MEQILSFYKQTELKSCRRSHVYLHLLIFLRTALGQGRKVLACSERKWITLQNKFSRVWSSLMPPSRLYMAAQKRGIADWWYFFSREAVSPRSLSSYTFSRYGHSPKRMLKSIEKRKKVPSSKLAICQVSQGSPEGDLQPIAFPLSTPGGSLSPVPAAPSSPWICST